MSEEEFQPFLAASCRAHADDQVRVGFLPADEALQIVEERLRRLLPAGRASPGHYFLAIVDDSSGGKVGGLWYEVQEQGWMRKAFVWDIAVDEQHRRKGYGSGAFQAMEEKLGEIGVTAVDLSVFGHNEAARAMYDKLGYKTTGLTMRKTITAE
jgi:ribosomal protein S18 acetylase RimI-like enzyme